MTTSRITSPDASQRTQQFMTWRKIDPRLQWTFAKVVHIFQGPPWRI